jgi:hypothetical protein
MNSQQELLLDVDVESLSDDRQPQPDDIPLRNMAADAQYFSSPFHCDGCDKALDRNAPGDWLYCTKCTNYDLCGFCFRLGRTSNNHSLHHEMRWMSGEPQLPQQPPTPPPQRQRIAEAIARGRAGFITRE